jgi:hypothetical protein
MKVHILLPPLMTLRHLLERLKSLDHHVTLAANMNGELRLNVSTDSVDITTFYRGLINPTISKISRIFRFPLGNYNEPMLEEEDKVGFQSGFFYLFSITTR